MFARSTRSGDGSQIGSTATGGPPSSGWPGARGRSGLPRGRYTRPRPSIRVPVPGMPGRRELFGAASDMVIM